LSVFALHRDRTEELYFITLVLILTACSPIAGYLAGIFIGLCQTTQSNLNLLIINSFYYFTIALTAASPSTATTTTPAGAAMVASEEVITVLAIV